MANCAQCSAELIGSAKFCATCGAPAAAAPASDEGPSTLSGLAAATPGASSGASGPSHGPASHVNPFAATASPTSHAAGGAPNEPGKRASEPRQPATGEAPDGAAPRSPSKPPPGADGSHVSPLAVSNALSQRGAFQEALASAEEKVRSSVAPPAAPRAKKPGTQLMQGAPSRPVAPAGEDPAPAPAAAKKAPPRTVAMSFNVGQPGAFQPPGVGAPGAPPSVAQSGGGPLQAPSLAQPSLAQPSLAQPGAAPPPSAIAP
ncbi:MAG: hypothetical protein KF782_22335, partial [Labilithrix sp.]|nr:hypothetical protein [Labilithrix sp.]